MSSAEEGFLSAIRTSPDDEGVRLIYADWLDENGDPDRAEFIRVQCELPRLEAWDPRRADLERREKGLLLRHGRRWGGGVFRKDDRHQFRRGFPEVVVLTAKAFLADAEELFRRFPLRRLNLARGIGDPALRSLAASPHLARLSELAIPSWCRMTTRGLAALAASPHVRGLKVLHIDSNDVGPEGARILAEAPNLAGLETLVLYGCRVGTAGAAALAASPHLARLTNLNLMVNSVGAAGAVAIAESPHLANLIELSFWNNEIGPAGVRALAAAPFPRLKRLYLSVNPLGLEGVNALAASPLPGRLTSLGLGVVCLNAPDAERVAVARALAESPHVAGLASLALFRNHIGDEGARALAASPHLSHLADLNLYENEVSDAGSQALLDSPHLKQLRRLTIQASNRLSAGQIALWRKRLGRGGLV
jgi:uncharacterized protein (TIGR02996 family)